jgi:ComF family protein
VHALKYEGWPELAGLMGDAVARLVARRQEKGARSDAPPVVVPVPTTAKRRRARGYNQAELLAARVATRCDLVLRHALTRKSGRRSQTALTPLERRENVRGAFRPRPDAAGTIRGADVLLVDDVLTTGATASEAALALSGIGAGSVTLLTFARALPDTPAKARSALS